MKEGGWGREGRGMERERERQIAHGLSTRTRVVALTTPKSDYNRE